MRKRQTKYMLAIPAALVIGIITFVIYAMVNDPTQSSTLPTDSTPGSLILTSNGCCFWVEDVRVWLEDENGYQYQLSRDERVSEYNIIKHRLPVNQVEPSKLHVSFQCFYGDQIEFSLPVLNISSIDDLRETGGLLYFQEHDDVYFNVIAGSFLASYKLGDSDSRWNLTASPGVAVQ